METIVGMVQNLQTFHGLFGFGCADKNAIALEFTTPYTPTQLVQLCQTEALRIFHHHYCGIGNIDTYFNYRGGDQDIDLLISKFFHDTVFVCRAHFPMEISHLNGRWQSCPEFLRIIYYILQVFRFPFLHHGTDDISLSACSHLFCDKFISLRTIGSSYNTVFDRQTICRQFINDGDLQISI